LALPLPVLRSAVGLIQPAIVGQSAASKKFTTECMALNMSLHSQRSPTCFGRLVDREEANVEKPEVTVSFVIRMLPISLAQLTSIVQ